MTPDLHSILLVIFGAAALAGAAITTWAASRPAAMAGMALLAAGSALVLADLSAGFAAVLVFVAVIAAAVLLPPPGEADGEPRAFNLGALACALLFAALAYAAYRGVFHSARYPGGQFNAGALGRLLLGRDPLALIAAGAAVLIGLGLAAPAVGRGRA